ncbi:MAG TPA: DUF368 domain-containing protein [Trueperaceae bacterium]
MRRDTSVESSRTGAGIAGLIPIYLRGVAMGAADIIPGVSGGTMALILGIYERLIEALRSIARPPFLRALFSGKFGRAFAIIDAAFLVALVAGIATSVVTLARLLSHLLETHPEFVFAFFFGLVFASVILVAQRIRSVTLWSWLLFAAGAVAAFLLVGLSPAETPDAAWFLFLSGAVAISALLLPGISGAFVLVLLGKYSYVLGAVTRGDIGALLAVGAGAVFGVLSFTQLLGWLFRKYHDATLALLCGVMLGSLRKVWPWQAEVDGRLVNLLPKDGFWSADGGAGWAILLALVGALLVVGLDYVAAQEERRAEAARRPAEAD